jgi:hypothetical protein
MGGPVGVRWGVRQRRLTIPFFQWLMRFCCSVPISRPMTSIGFPFPRQRRERNSLLKLMQTQRRHWGMSQMCAASAVRQLLSVNPLVRQIVLVPQRIENAAAAGKADAENPGEVPHRLFPLIKAG